MNGAKLLELSGVCKSFRTADGAAHSVLEQVGLTLYEGEIVALLGKSGSGKSTLLRIMAGLIPADRGSVTWQGRDVSGPAENIAMVFQSFALFPWLTVRQNVELGLEAGGMPPPEREKVADAMLDLIGLSGFSGALPRELSGGMKQRVGIARALAVNPALLLMDEAFSALDVLTGENLRDDMLELWQTQKTPLKSILVVSHNIEEAVVMADRIIVLASDPGRIRAEIPVDLPRPRLAEAPDARALIDEVYSMMTMRAVPDSPHSAARMGARLGYRLPKTDIFRMEGLMQLLAEAPFNGHADLPRLAEEAELPDDELFPAYEALSLLGLALVDKGDITLTPIGKRYIKDDPAQKHEIFGQQLLTHVPLAAHIRRGLEQAPGGSLPGKPFTELLENFLKSDEAELVLKVAIEWGRYGEVYEYDYHTGLLSLPKEQERPEPNQS